VNTELTLYTLDTGDVFNWTLPSGIVVTTTDSFLVVNLAQLTDAGAYSVSVGVNGCTSDGSNVTQVIVNGIPNNAAYAGEDFLACPGDEPIRLSADSDPIGEWTTNSSAVIASPNNPSTIITNLTSGGEYKFYWTVLGGACGGTSTDSVIVTVPLEPIANKDSFKIVIDRITDLDILGNDTLRGEEVTIEIVRQPKNGDVFVNGDQTITYEPDNGFLGEDSLIYKICLVDCPNSCDTAIVKFTVEAELIPCDIITPNNDGMNDEFCIQGLENYPDNEIFIYNRWGNEIYNERNYKGDWDGKYKGQPSPDGTYYYVLINRATGKALLTGYLTIHR
jgi:gliding motility-associated-like protein